MTTFGPFTISTTSTGIGDAGVASQRAKLLGYDIWFDIRQGLLRADYEVTPAGDWRFVDGEEALRQALLRRLLTSPGQWAFLPSYGVGAQDFVKARNDRPTRDRLAERIRSQFLQDPRVEAVESVAIEINPESLRIAVRVKAKAQVQTRDTVLVAVEVS